MLSRVIAENIGDVFLRHIVVTESELFWAQCDYKTDCLFT